MSFFENTRKPVGLGGKIMVAMMNFGHSAMAAWGLHFLAACPGCHGAGLRLRRWSEHQNAAEAVSQGQGAGHRLFGSQCRKSAKGQCRCHCSRGKCTVQQASVAELPFEAEQF